MDSNLHSTINLGVKDILWLGKEPFTLLPEEEQLSDYRFRSMRSPARAYQYLKDTLNSSKEGSLPYAIIVDYNLLKSENFHFLDTVFRHPVFRIIPFVVHIDANEKLDSKEALTRGIDDYISWAWDWERLEGNLRFLRKYKAKILEHREKNEPVETFIEYKTPRAKRAFDVVVALTVLAFVCIPMLLIALAIKLTSKGNIIYRSKRVGTGYQVFDFLKFRSMYPDADKRLKEMMKQNQYKDQKDAAFVKFANDPRVTPIGRIIRKTSLDELPQLFNVLKGEMSIVGNRPLPLYEAKMLTRDQWVNRFFGPAGITGLWQVTKRGKNNMSTEERVSLDCEYADNYSFWYDMKILWKTIPAMIQQEDV